MEQLKLAEEALLEARYNQQCFNLLLAVTADIVDLEAEIRFEVLDTLKYHTT